MATVYNEITDEVKANLMALAEGQLYVKDKTANGQPVREYKDVQVQFKTFPVKYILEGIDAGLSPEDISDNLYYWFKYGKEPSAIQDNPTSNSLYRGVHMKAYVEGPDDSNETDNILRFICGKVLVELRKLVKTESV